ncbi:unnamed protein product [Phytomonas sp. EM1]|nr:unnamed protein product [Phytomonas sp. EM1]|eukprot:CCW64655.1 unnamed protein product [Phytomonas sp. isolate EM1]
MGCKMSSLRTAHGGCHGRADPNVPPATASPRSSRRDPFRTPASPSVRLTSSSPLTTPLSILSSKKSGKAVGPSLPFPDGDGVDFPSSPPPEPMEKWVPLKTDAAQAAQEYQTRIQAKEEAKLAKAARLQMEIIDPIRPLDSFNVSHRAILGRCWDRRAAERFPIHFVHSLLEAAKGTTAATPSRRPGNSATLSRGRKSRHKRGKNAMPKTNLSRRSHWFSTCGISTECPTSAFLRAAAPSSGTFGTHSLRLLNRVDMLNLDTHVLETDSKVRVFNELKNCVAHLLATNTLTDIDLVLFFHTPSEVAKLPNDIREKFFHLITGFMPYYRGIKNTSAFRLSEMVDETDKSTLFLRKRNLKPAYGVQVARWNRVEVVIPNLNTLAHAVALIQDEDWISLISDRSLNELQPGGRHDNQGRKRSIDPTSLGKHFITEKINGSFTTPGSHEHKVFYESSRTLRASSRHPTITKAYQGGVNEAPKRFPEEFILSLMIETLEESYHNIKHLIPSCAAAPPTGNENKKRQGDIGEVFPVLPGPLPQAPTEKTKKANTLANNTSDDVDKKAFDEGPTSSQKRFISVVVASFQVFIDPFEWKERHYTRYPIDFSINQHSARSEYGEGIITDIMYGGMLFIECCPPEAADELKRVLQDMDWSKARTAEGILNNVRNLFTARHTISKGYGHIPHRNKDVAAEKDARGLENKRHTTAHFRYRITRRIGGIPMRDSVEIKQISVFFGGGEVLEHTISTPTLAKGGGGGGGGGLAAEASVDGAAAADPRPDPHKRSDAYSLIASAWMGMETISAVIQTWGMHLLCNPEYAHPLSLFLQKFSGIAPALLQKILPIDLKMHDGISAGSSTSSVSEDSRTPLSDKAEGTDASTVDAYSRPTSITAGYSNHHTLRSEFFKSSLCNTPLADTMKGLSLNESMVSVRVEREGGGSRKASPLLTATPSPNASRSRARAGKNRGRDPRVDKKSRNAKSPPGGATVAPRQPPSKAKRKRQKTKEKGNPRGRISPVRRAIPKRGAAMATKGGGGIKGRSRRRLGRYPSEATINSTNRWRLSPMGTLGARSSLSGSSSTLQTLITRCGTLDGPLGVLGELDLEERWNMATLELKAQKNDLADLLSSVRAAEAAHSALLADLSVLQRAILPRTTGEDLDPALLYLETAIFEPDELPGWCLCLNNADWLPRLVAVLTSAENVIRHVQVVTPLTPKDFPKLGMLAGLLYYPSASASLWCLEFDATNLFGNEAAAAAAAIERSRREAASGGHSDGDSKNAPDHRSPSPSRSRKGTYGGGNSLDGAIPSPPLPSGFSRNGDLFQTTDCGFATENNHGFGANCPLFYVSPEQALDTLWLLLCAIAENLAFSPSPAASWSGLKFASDRVFRIYFHRAGRPEVTAQPVISPEEDSRHRHQSIFKQMSAFLTRTKGSPSRKQKNKHGRDGEALHDSDDSGPFHLSQESLLLEPFVSTSVTPEPGSSPPAATHPNGGKEIHDGGKDRPEDARSGFPREPGSPFLRTASSLAATSQSGSFSCMFLHVDGGEGSDASGNRRGGGKEEPRWRDSIPGGIPIHRHFPKRPSWVHGNARVLELPFFTLPYHDESLAMASPTTPSPLGTSSSTLDLATRPIEVARSAVGHYVNPYNSHHNCSRFYLTVQRRLQLQRLLQRARERCACRREGGAVSIEAADTSAPGNGEGHVRFFGLSDAKEEEAVLQEQEVRLAGQAEDIWHTLTKIVNSYNHHLLNTQGPKLMHSNHPSFREKEHLCEESLNIGSPGNDLQMAPRMIILER